MVRRVICVAIILAFTNLLLDSCMRTARVPADKILRSEEKITAVVLLNGDYIRFMDKDTGAVYYPEDETVKGLDYSGKLVSVKRADILYAEVRKTDVALTIVASLGVIAVLLAVVVAIALATKESCPFVYSFDGEKYVFDAEPYGGATCEGLKRMDYSRLEHLKPSDGKYKLMVRNEVNETQYTDLMTLLVVDHPKGSDVIPDIAGNMHLIKTKSMPCQTTDEAGNDLLNFVRERDDVAWQTRMPIKGQFPDDTRRHTLEFKFPRPAGMKKAWLLINCGTALWGSEMIRKMLELRGNEVDTWYDGIKRRGPEYTQLHQFMEREELYVLKLYLNEGGAWAQQGFLMGGGPFITEDRIVPLDLSRVVGDTATIRFNPPVGFWSFDYVGIEYEDCPAPVVTEVSLASAVDQYGNNVVPALSAADDQYEILPRIGDWARLSFDVPPQARGTKRSVFLKSSGYYELHLSKDTPAQTELIDTLLTTPGLIVDYSKSEYLKWRTMQANVN